MARKIHFENSFLIARYSGTETENDDENQSQRKISVEEYIARALAKELMKDPKYQDQVSPQNHQKNIIFNIL